MISNIGKAIQHLAVICVLIGAVVPAYAQVEAKLPFDTPTMVAGIETVCTGVGVEATSDPRWNLYPLKVVLAGEGGQFLAGARVSVSEGDKILLEVVCDGLWVLFKLMPAQYQVTASVNGASVKSRASVTADKQGRIVLRFPAVGGARSPEHTPPSE